MIWSEPISVYSMIRLYYKLRSLKKPLKKIDMTNRKIKNFSITYLYVAIKVLANSEKPSCPDALLVSQEYKTRFALP